MAEIENTTKIVEALENGSLRFDLNHLLSGRYREIMARCGVPEKEITIAERNKAGEEVAALILVICKTQGTEGLHRFYRLLEEKGEKMSVRTIQKSPLREYFRVTEAGNSTGPPSSVLVPNNPPKDNSAESKPSRIDVAIIVPLTEEYDQLLECLQKTNTEVVDEFIDGQFYHRFTRNGLSCAVRIISDMGNVPASNAVHAFLRAFTPKVFIAAGCAGSIKVTDLHLLDVIAAKQCDIATAKGAVIDGPDGHMDFQFSGDPYKSDGKFLNAYENLPRSATDKAIYEALLNDCQKMLLEKANNDPEKVKAWVQKYHIRNAADAKKSMMQSGTIASTDAVGKTTKFGKWLQTHDRKYLAVEMEGGGVASALHSTDKNYPLLLVRGITDAADDAKNNMEEDAKEAFRHCGIYNVMRVVVALLDSKSFTLVLK